MTLSRRKGPAEVDLGALVDALGALAPADDASRVAIARLLGFDWRGVPREAPPQSTPSLRPAAEKIVLRPPKLPKPNPRSGRPPGHQPILIVPAERAELEPELLFQRATQADAGTLPRTDAKTHLGRPEYVPLVVPGWTRGVLSALVATHEPSTEIDWREIERTLLQGAPLVRLPWRRLPSLRRGVEVWLDLSESMQPFRRDQVMLVRDLRRLLGRQALRTFSYKHDPLLPRETRLRWDRARPRESVAGVGVVIVSDFGVGRAGGGGESMLEALEPWLEQARHRGCPVRALIPAPAASWSRGLADRLVGFEWDRTLSAGGIGARTRPSRTRP